MTGQKANNKSTSLTATIGFLIALLVSPVWAQEDDSDQDGASQSNKLEEVIVTAQRKANNLQRVPIAVTSFSGEMIERADISNPLELSTRIPGFTFSPFSPGQAIFSLRGISSNDDGAGTENSVVVFLDDVYFGRISNAAFEFFDVDRIEVLRGPQGTQFGRNAIGGAINITSKKPSLDKNEIKVKASIGNYSKQKFGAYVTGPLGGNFAAKISLATTSQDGFVTNILTGNKLKNQNSTSFRGQLLWAVDNTEITLTASTQDEDNADIARMPLSTAGVRGAFDAAGGSVEDLIAVTPQEGFSKRNSDIYSIKVEHSFDFGGVLTYVGGYYETLADWEMDSVGILQANVVDDIFDETQVFTQEIRYAQDLSDSLDIVAGVFYLDENTDRTEYFRLVRGIDDRNPRRAPAVVEGVTIVDGVVVDEEESAVGIDLEDSVGGYRQVNSTKSIAAFFHANWEFLENLSVGLGIRYTNDSKTIQSSGFASGPDGSQGFIILQNFGDIDTGEGIEDEASFANISPKVSLNWQVSDDMLVYASYARGFKSGGFGAAPPNAADAEDIAVDQELADSFELGLKGQFLEDTLRVNLAAFYLSYKDLQFQRFGSGLAFTAADDDDADAFETDDSFGFFDTVNAGNANVLGFEGEIVWLPVAGLTLSASYGYLNTEAEFNFREYFTTDPGRDIIITEELNRAPNHKLALSALFEHSVGDFGRLLWSADFRYTSDRRADVASDATLEAAHQLVDANVTWVASNEKWEISLWGKNLLDERYFSHVYVIGPGQIGTLGEPRTYGVSVNWKL